MRVFGMGVCGVVMVVVMIMVVIMPVVVVMVIMVVIGHHQAAHPRAEAVAMHAVCDIRSRCVCALPLDVVVMAFLHGTDLGLEAQHLHTVFAQNTSRRRDGTESGVITVFGFDVVVVTILQSQHLLAVGTDPAVGRGVSLSCSMIRSAKVSSTLGWSPR